MRNLRQATLHLYEASGTDRLADNTVGEEVFGPLGLIIRVADMAQMLAIAHSLQDPLTCTLPSQHQFWRDIRRHDVDPLRATPGQRSKHAKHLLPADWG
ncbi:MAG: hypothetical protein K9G71_13020 [Rhodobacteraceae bacterium]|nr:hypothetical protein [Paracoccaceae bacterium]MCF8515274.1 hypothetical protein [Paracoccaceae bacterium]MCF8519542.1 hypothetical protein [Paracoccaceae bacterium]